MEKIANNFDMRKYFQMAAWLMLIVALGSTYSAIVTWNLMDLGLKVSKVAGILFNLLLVVLFVYMVSTQPKPQDMEDAHKQLEDMGFYDEN